MVERRFTKGMLWQAHDPFAMTFKIQKGHRHTQLHVCHMVFLSRKYEADEATGDSAVRRFRKLGIGSLVFNKMLERLFCSEKLVQHSMQASQRQTCSVHSTDWRERLMLWLWGFTFSPGSWKIGSQAHTPTA